MYFFTWTASICNGRLKTTLKQRVGINIIKRDISKEDILYFYPLLDVIEKRKQSGFKCTIMLVHNTQIKILSLSLLGHNNNGFDVILNVNSRNSRVTAIPF